MKIITTLEVWPGNLPGVHTWCKAKEACEALGEGWRLPTVEELDLLYRNKDKIGGFGEGWLWSSSQYDDYDAWRQRFSDGTQVDDYKYYGSFGVRAVRTTVEVAE